MTTPIKRYFCEATHAGLMFERPGGVWVRHDDHLAALEAQAREIEALQGDAEQYRWLRAQHWDKGTLAVLRSADLPLGVQTFSGQLLDDAITVRRMAAPVPEAGG